MGKAKASLSSELLRDNHGRYAEEVALALFGCNGGTGPLQKRRNGHGISWLAVCCPRLWIQRLPLCRRRCCNGECSRRTHSPTSEEGTHPNRSTRLDGTCAQRQAEIHRRHVSSRRLYRSNRDFSGTDECDAPTYEEQANRFIGYNSA